MGQGGWIPLWMLACRPTLDGPFRRWHLQSLRPNLGMWWYLFELVFPEFRCVRRLSLFFAWRSFFLGRGRHRTQGPPSWQARLSPPVPPGHFHGCAAPGGALAVRTLRLRLPFDFPHHRAIDSASPRPFPTKARAQRPGAPPAGASGNPPPSGMCCRLWPCRGHGASSSPVAAWCAAQQRRGRWVSRRRGGGGGLRGRALTRCPNAIFLFSEKAHTGLALGLLAMCAVLG